jgi:CRISPR/Cas system-associated exonuclease Cas4 (RecB family)
MEIIRASEVGEYVYCARAWWLRRVAGEEPEGAERRQQGVLLHTRHGEAMRTSGLLMGLAIVLLLIGLLLIVF